MQESEPESTHALEELMSTLMLDLLTGMYFNTQNKPQKFQVNNPMHACNNGEHRASNT